MKTAPNGGLGAMKNEAPCDARPLSPSGARSTYHQAFRTGKSAASFARASPVASRRAE